MKLRFIGEDTTRKLKTGVMYDVEVRTVREYMVVIIDDPAMGRIYRPYKSPGTLCHDWRSS